MNPDATIERPDARPAIWTIETPIVHVGPAEETYQCTYFSVPRDLPPIARIYHYGDAGVHDVSVELFSGEAPEEARDCRRSPQAATLYNSKHQIDEILFPEGAPLALGAGLTALVRIHVLNPFGESTDVRVVMSWFAATRPASRTTGLLAKSRTDFVVPRGAMAITMTCEVPTGVGIASVLPLGQAHSFRLAVSDATGELVSTFDWAHPDVRVFADPFYTPSGSLTATCEYLNDGPTVAGGDRMFADERCGVSAWIVPGAGLRSCGVE